MTQTNSAGVRFRAAVNEEFPLQVMGAITAYAGLMAKRVGYKALYLSGGGVAANSLGVPVTTANGEYTRIEGLPVDEFSRAAMDKTLAELEEERAGVAHLL